MKVKVIYSKAVYLKGDYLDLVDSRSSFLTDLGFRKLYNGMWEADGETKEEEIDTHSIETYLSQVKQKEIEKAFQKYNKVFLLPFSVKLDVEVRLHAIAI